MNKLSKKEYISRAARLYGLEEHEIKDLENHIDGKTVNEFIVRRNARLFKMYDIYMSKAYNEHMDTDENGIINLDDYLFTISKRRLQDSKIGKSWIISSNLDSYLITNRHSSDIKEKWIKISEKNNFILPQIAKQLNLDATIYYKGKYSQGEDEKETIFFMTKDFIEDGETFIQGKAINKRQKGGIRIDFENLLEDADKYVKKYYKKHKFSLEETEEARKAIRQGLIKQTLFNKLVFNDNESNSKWGLIIGKDSRLRLAPLYSFDYCAGAESFGKSQHRVIQKRKEDVETFVKKYGEEEWFSSWIKEEVIPLDFDKAILDAKYETGVGLTSEEETYYKFTFQKIHSRIVEAYQQIYGEGASSPREKKGDDLEK